MVLALFAPLAFTINACAERSGPAGGGSAQPKKPAASSDTVETRSDGQAALDPALLKRGLAAFGKGMCAKCHLENGTGGERAPDLTDDEWLHCDGTVAGIRKVLESGVPRGKLKDPNRPFAMNPVTNLVPDSDDLDALAAYVHSLSE